MVEGAELLTFLVYLADNRPDGRDVPFSGRARRRHSSSQLSQMVLQGYS